MSELTWQSTPLEQAALAQLRAAKVAPDPNQSYLTQLMWWGLQSDPFQERVQSCLLEQLESLMRRKD